MPTVRSEPGSRRSAALLAALLLSLSALAGCSGDGDESATVPMAPTADDVVPRMEQVLRKRARALTSGNERRFLASVDQTDTTFLNRQRVYFANIAQLPLATLSYRVDPDSLTRRGRGFDAVVQVSLQLEGYDTEPVVRPARFHFSADPDGDGVLVAGDRDLAWEQRTGVDVQPWDSGAVTIISGSGVLGVFDDSSARVAPQVIAAVEAGIAQVSRVVPYDWSGNVVVYALSDTDLLQGLDDLPAEDPDTLDAVAFPISVRPGGVQIASTRFLLHPRMLDSDPTRLARLIRHELTHVALGSRDDAVPTWLGEGVAEWVSVQSLPRDERLISQQTINLARGTAVLPSDIDFNGADQSANYGLAWWACESIVDMYGEPRLWQLLDELASTNPPEQAGALEETLGLDADQLAREAARRIIATYG